MEEKAAKAHKQISEIGDLEYFIVAIAPTAQDAFHAYCKEQQIGECIDELSSVSRGIIILQAERMKVNGLVDPSQVQNFQDKDLPPHTSLLSQ